MEIARGSRLRTLAQVRLAPVLERVLKTAFGARVQRLGAQALGRVVARFPGIAELVGVRRGQHQVAIGNTGFAAVAASVVEAEITQPAPLDTLLARLAEDPSWQVRARSAAELARAGGDEIIEPLLRSLEDPSAEVAAAAIEALAERRLPRVIASLEKVLRNREGYFSPITRAAAVQALARGASDAARLEPVIGALSDVDAEVSLAAIAALSEHAPAVAAQHIRPLVEDRSGYFLPFVQHAASRALARMGAQPA